MNLTKIVMDAIDWIESLFHKEYGIRVLYMAILLIPSVSLYVLYRKEVVNNEKIVVLLNNQSTNYYNCLEQKSILKAEVREEVRKEVLTEFRDVFETINEFQIEIMMENSKTIDKIKKYESKLK